MPEAKTSKPKTSKPRTPKAKPTPPGQGTMDFNSGGRGGALQQIQRGFTRTSVGDATYTGQPRPKPKPKTGGALTTTQPSTPSRGGSSFGVNGQQATGRFREVMDLKTPSGLGNRSRTQLQNIIEPPTPSRSGGSFGSNGVKATGPFGNRGNGLAVRPQPPYPVVPPRPIDGGKVNTPNPGPVRPRPIPGPTPPTPRVVVNSRSVIPSAPDIQVRPKPGALQVVDKADDAAKVIGGVVKGKPKSKWGLIAAGLGAAALGTGYLMSRRNENEDAAKPQQAGANISIPGRNSPPSSGNEADRALYPAPDGPTNTAGSKASEPGLSARVRNNQKANRSPQDYLGEAFDATIKRGRDVGRKHLQGMLVRDSIDDSTARNLMSRYDKEIGSQRTLKDYKSEGVAEKFDRENPGKAGRILDEYRGMGRRDGAAPAGATYAQIKERALR